MAKRRCRYGKLKSPRGRRVCRTKRGGRGSRRGRVSRRRSRRGAVRLPFILAGVGALGLLAYTASTAATTP